MKLIIVNLALAALLYLLLRAVLSFRRDLKAARQSGIPYIVSPAYVYDKGWILLSNALLPILRKVIPLPWQGLWLDMLHPEWAWISHYLPFKHDSKGMGVDTFLVISPFKTSLFTADPNVIQQIAARRNDFRKPIEMYQGIDIYGKNVVTTEGLTWRRHRKSTVPPFGEKNNRIVWIESIHQANEMLTHWQAKADVQSAPEREKMNSRQWTTLLRELSHDTMRLSLYVISRAGFDVRCDWPGRASSTAEGVMSATKIPEGHKMSYVDSLESLLLRLIALFLLPPWLLNIAPSAYLRRAGRAFIEWGGYMDNIYTAKKAEIEESKKPEEEGLDLMGAMIRTSGQIPGTINYGKKDAGLTKDEILGNSFILFLAGHETAANTIHFSMIFLALRPSVQRKLQADLDEILGNRDSSQWSYDDDLPKLFAGMAGAVMNEELRLIPPITTIPKCTLPNSPQVITINGKECMIPGGSTVGLVASAVQRNPKYWPYEKMDCESGNDLDEFRPERWFIKADVADEKETKQAGFSALSTDGLGIDSSPDTADTFFRPVRGAYIPFSEGARACLGRRFAQVEILAALAVIFQKYSVELSVDDYASSGEVNAMSQAERKTVWSKAKEEARRKMREEMGSIITLQLRGKPIKLRICSRGQEQFDFVDD